MAASASRIAANRANALKSTGPKTQEGKERSRRNGLRHGMAAEVCLLPEDQALLAERLETWTEALRPRDELQRDLVARAAAASVRLKRCARVEAAALAEKVRHAKDDWDRERARLVAELGERLPEAPHLVVIDLRRTAAGCAWMVERWGWLAEALKGVGRWSVAQHELAQQLMGWLPFERDVHPQAVAMRVVARGLEARDREDEAEARRVAEYRAGLAQFVAGQVADLEARRERLERDLDGPDREEAPLRAQFDGGPLAVLLRRYETGHDLIMHRALGLVAKLQKAEGAGEESDTEAIGHRKDGISTAPAEEDEGESTENRSEANEASETDAYPCEFRVSVNDSLPMPSPVAGSLGLMAEDFGRIGAEYRAAEVVGEM